MALEHIGDLAQLGSKGRDGKQTLVDENAEFGVVEPIGQAVLGHRINIIWTPLPLSLQNARFP